MFLRFGVSCLISIVCECRRTGQLILDVLWSGAASSLSNDIQQKSVCFCSRVLKTLFTTMSTAELFEILFSCVCAKGRSCRPSVQTPLTAVLKTVTISQVVMSVFNILQFGERCMRLVAYREGREVHQWSLGDKCSVPTGPRFSYMINQVGLVDGWWSDVSLEFSGLWILVKMYSSISSNLQKWKLILSELGNHKTFLSISQLIYFHIRLHLSLEAPIDQCCDSWTTKKKMQFTKNTIKIEFGITWMSLVDICSI